MFRGLIVVVLLGIGGAAVWSALDHAGFRFRWDVDPPSPPSAERPVLREAPAPSVRGGAPARREAPGPSVSAGAPVLSEAVSAAMTPGTTDSTIVRVVRPPPPGRGPVGSGRHERIEFETYSDGRPVAANTYVAEEWRAQGLVVSFESYSASSTLPYVLDAAYFRPQDASMHALSYPVSGDRGLEVGVIHLDFPGRPRSVTFTLFGPDLIADFKVIAWSGGERLPDSARTHVPDMQYASEDDPEAEKATYSPGGRARFRAERIRIDAPLGIDRISVDGWGPPGHVLLVDHLAIDP